MMASESEEVEIKIEYNESFETDPLCENIEEKTTVNPIDGESQDNFSEFTELSQHSVINPEVESCDENVDCDMNSKIIEANSVMNENEATWYKQIDESGRYLCRFCSLTYSTIQTLRFHVKTKHPDDAKALKEVVLNNKRNRKLKCHICNKRFKMINDLKSHVQSEHNIDNVETSCKICDATFQSREDVSEHLFYKHKVVNRHVFSCSICGYRTSKKSHYNQHNNTHLKEKNMQCKYCNYCTNYLPNLKIHERIHSDSKPYTCDYKGCEYRSSAKSALRSHQLKHNREENMLYCDKCSYKTVYKQSLKKHIESHVKNRLK